MGNPLAHWHIVAWLLVALLCFASCKVKRPGRILSDKKMEEVLYDYHVAKAMADQVPYNDQFKRVLYVESVFKKHGISKADFDTSMVWFSRNPNILDKVYERVNERLKAERDGVDNLIALREEKPKETASGDSIDVWMWKHIYRLTGVPMNNKLTFTLPADTCFHDRDTLRWSVRFRFLDGLPDTTRLPVMAMQIQYEKNDTVIGTRRLIGRNGTDTLTLAADTLGKIKEVRGFIYFPNSQARRSLQADRISLMRYHATDTLPTLPVDSLKAVADSLRSDSLKEPKEKPIELKELNGNRPLRPVRPRPRG